VSIKIPPREERVKFLVGTLCNPRYRKLRAEYREDVEQCAAQAAAHEVRSVRELERVFWRLLERLAREVGWKRSPTDPKEVTDENRCVECGERPGVYRTDDGKLCRRCGMRARKRKKKELAR